MRSLGERLPSSRGTGKAAAILGAMLVLLWCLVAYTPIAHPRDLQIEGVTGLSADRITAALEETGRSQSTFAVSESDLMDAVADYPEVAAITIDSHPPFRLDLVVVMRPPVARAQIGGSSFTLAADGTVLKRANEAAVPKLDDSVGSLKLVEGRVRGGGGSLTVLGAAPDSLLGLVRNVRRGTSGLEIELERGPRLIFGNASAAPFKWAAAAAVLAEGTAGRASYIDVRVPGRPAVGGLGGSRTAGSTESAPPSLTAVAPADAATTSGAAGAAAAATAATAHVSPQVAAEAPAPAAAAPVASAPAQQSAPVEPAGNGTTSAPEAATGAGTESASSSGGASLSGGATP